MLQLWTYIPLRQRNMREMQLGDNLYKDVQGAWRLTFRGEQLKVATRRGRTNVFDVPFPQQLIPLLENYLATWRPILLARAGHPDNHVFLTTQGTPYNQTNLTRTTQDIVYSYTGKHWHPHIVRTVWATEWIRNGGDFLTVAKMLNDRLETVIANYAHLLEEDVAENAYRLIDERNSQGK
jgi:site-specific recombinase XerD